MTLLEMKQHFQKRNDTFRNETTLLEIETHFQK